MVMAETFFTTKMRRQWMLVYFITYALIILQWQAEDPSRIFNINILIVDFNVRLSSLGTKPHWTWPNCSSLHCQDCKAHEFGIILGTMKRRTFLPWNTLPKKNLIGSDAATYQPKTKTDEKILHYLLSSWKAETRRRWTPKCPDEFFYPSVSSEQAQN